MIFVLNSLINNSTSIIISASKPVGSNTKLVQNTGGGSPTDPQY